MDPILSKEREESPGVGSEHYHRSRYPHARVSYAPDGLEYSAIRCQGTYDAECAAVRVSGEISRMTELAFRDLGGKPEDLLAQHEAEHPEDWQK